MTSEPKLTEQEDQILEMLDEQIESQPAPEEKVDAKGAEEQETESTNEEQEQAEDEPEESSEESQEELDAEPEKVVGEDKEEVQEEKVEKHDEKISEATEADKRNENRIAALQAQLEEVSSKAMEGDPSKVNINQEQKSAEQIEEENKQEEKPDKEKKVVRDLLPFVNDDVYEKVLSDPKELNNLLNRVYDSAISQMTQSIPQLVGQMVTQQTQMKTLVDEFYKENEDLVPMKSYVGFVANELAAKHPDWAYDKLFKEVAKDVRKRVNISNKASRVETKAKSQRPAFAKKPSGRSSVTSKLDDLEQDIVDLM